ncbi:Chloride channel protein CLC-c [Acorus calamus]|uniref:Chloride channel protein CLC-c n=1 Tax=Acorus calamus TaxID=4465 RepID=A0AAV9FEK3_ACOCL|nr:Chloride channel protein CLC-c [Acorus calamus]
MDVQHHKNQQEGDIESSEWTDGMVTMMEKQESGPKEPLLLRRRTLNTTSQIAIVGSNVCPIESLDYE